MMNNLLKWGRGLTLPVLLIPLVVFIGAVYLFPNGIEPRIQRELSFIAVMLFGAGLLICRASFSIGVLIIYLSALCFIYPNHSPDAMIYFLFSIFFIFIVMTHKSWKDHLDLFYDVICGVALLNVLWEVSQYFKFYLLITPKAEGDIITGLMSNPNEVGVLLAICLPAFLRKQRFYFLPFIFIGLWLAGSMNGWLTSLIILSVYLVKNWKQAIGAFLSIFILASVFGFYSDHFSLVTQKKVRLDVYVTVAKLAAVEPLGYGLGQFKHIFPLATSYKYLTGDDRKILAGNAFNKNKLNHALTVISDGKLEYFSQEQPVYKSCYFQAHNEYLEFWFEAGILGLLLMLYVLLVQLVTNWKKNVCFYGILAAGITSLFFFTWHIIPMAVITVLYLGIATGERNNGNFRLV